MVSYGYTIIVFSIVLAGLVLSALSPVVNDISDNFDDSITAGVVSEQTAGNYENSVRVFKYIVPMSILGVCILYGVTRAQIQEME